jgi:opacity protein-like surface antigen
MKKVTILLIMLLGIGLVQARPATADYNKFSVVLGAGVRNFTGDTDDVYKLVNLTFCLDLGFRFIRSVEVFLHTDFLIAKGNLTISEEETTITIIPIEVGGRYLIGTSSFCPYVGAGLGFYLINEENPIGTVNESGLGFFAEAGLKYLLGKSISIDAKLKYVILSIRPEDTSINLGGPTVLLGFGFSF